WFDTPQPHALSYFTEDPFLRDDGNDFCVLCTSDEKAKLHLTWKARTEILRLGVLGGFTIFDALYYFQDSEKPDWKFILVKTGLDEYREIFHVQRTQIDQYIGPSHIVTIGNNQILDARAFVGGNKGLKYGDYFWFGKNGAVVVDVEGPALKAAVPRLPRGTKIFGDVEVNFPTLTARVPVTNRDASLCCSGSVEIKFKLVNGQIVVIGARYVD